MTESHRPQVDLKLENPLWCTTKGTNLLILEKCKCFCRLLKIPLYCYFLSDLNSSINFPRKKFWPFFTEQNFILNLFLEKIGILPSKCLWWEYRTLFTFRHGFKASKKIHPGKNYGENLGEGKIYFHENFCSAFFFFQIIIICTISFLPPFSKKKDKKCLKNLKQGFQLKFVKIKIFL